MSPLFCGIAMALGWGLRGEFGGPAGAMIPGAFMGLAIALTSGRSDWLRKAPIFGAAGAFAFALGGTMSYGRIIGYTRGIDMPNVMYGFAMLGVVGGLWGAFGAGCIGLVASGRRYAVWQIVAFVATAYLLGKGLHWLLVDMAGLRMTPPRGDGWPECIGACMALRGLCWLKRDALPPRLMLWGLMAGSIGFMLGDAIQVCALSTIRSLFDWWKVMEMTFGFILGAGIAYGVRCECADAEPTPPPPYVLLALGFLVVVWFVPWVTVQDLLGNFREKDIIRIPEGGIDTIWHFHVRLFAVLGMLVFIAWHLRRHEGPIVEPELGAKGLFLWAMWVCLFLGDWKMALPQWGLTSMSIHAVFLACATVLTLWAVLGLRPAQSWGARRVPLRIVAPAFALLFAVLCVVVSAAAIASHNGEWPEGGAHLRFGEEPTLDTTK